ncbi:MULTISPECIES: hypothetical protein [unclassified Endozoicomonas]|uniref:hypothetical protein n=1 Tax=unclassified Endozoicomonas TaxID=2644528 RepID=UPI002148D0F8|nr:MULTISPECIES: hypothetical protein [unclassified Endozoicomonas]
MMSVVNGMSHPVNEAALKDGFAHSSRVPKSDDSSPLLKSARMFFHVRGENEAILNTPDSPKV